VVETKEIKKDRD